MPSEQVAAQRIADILQVTQDLVAVYGFDTLRLRDIASQAGISIGMIQHYFPSRSDLMFQALRQSSVNRAQEWSLARRSRDRGVDQVLLLLEQSISNHSRCAVWLETCSAAARHSNLREIVSETQRLWRQHLMNAIALAVKQQDITLELEVEDIVELLVGLIDGLMLTIATDDNAELNQARRVRLLHQVFTSTLKSSTNVN